MESDELKNVWLSLDERLKKQEILKENILKQMIHTKSEKSLNRLSNYEWLGVIIIPLLIPFILWRLETTSFSQMQTYVFYGYIVLTIPLTLWQIAKVYTLSKVNFSNTISHNVRIVNRYNLYIKREKLAGVFLIPLVIISIILLTMEVQMELWRWILIGSVIAFTIVFSCWIYKKLYKKHIDSILKSFDELKELEE